MRFVVLWQIVKDFDLVINWCRYGSNGKQVDFGPYTGLLRNRHQAITRNDDVFVYWSWHIYMCDATRLQQTNNCTVLNQQI